MVPSPWDLKFWNALCITFVLMNRNTCFPLIHIAYLKLMRTIRRLASTAVNFSWQNEIKNYLLNQPVIFLVSDEHTRTKKETTSLFLIFFYCERGAGIENVRDSIKKFLLISFARISQKIRFMNNYKRYVPKNEVENFTLGKLFDLWTQIFCFIDLNNSVFRIRVSLFRGYLWMFKFIWEKKLVHYSLFNTYVRCKWNAGQEKQLKLSRKNYFQFWINLQNT